MDNLFYDGKPLNQIKIHGKTYDINKIKIRDNEGNEIKSGEIVRDDFGKYYMKCDLNKNYFGLKNINKTEGIKSVHLSYDDFMRLHEKDNVDPNTYYMIHDDDCIESYEDIYGDIRNRMNNDMTATLYKSSLSNSNIICYNCKTGTMIRDESDCIGNKNKFYKHVCNYCGEICYY